MIRKVMLAASVLGMIATTAKAAPIMPDATKLVAYYLFDEASGSTVLDGKGNAGNNGTMVGDTIARVATTPFLYAGNTAMSFDGGDALVTTDDDYVAIPVGTNNLSFTKNGAFSISAWFKTSTVAAGSLVSRSAATAQYNVLVKGGATPGPVAALIGGGTGGATSGAYNDGNWHNVVLSYSPNVGKIYVDGTEVVSSFSPGSATSIAVDTLIGARRASVNAGSAAAFTGLMDDVGFFNYALSADEAAWLGDSQNNGIHAMVTPEPATLCLLALGGLFAARRRR